MRNKIKKMLMEIGISPSLNGFDYLTDAIMLCMDSKKYLKGVTKILYPEIAEKNETTGSRVERGIRHAIEKAYESGSPDLYEKIPVCSNLKKSKLTNSEFIATICELIKMEDDIA